MGKVDQFGLLWVRWISLDCVWVRWISLDCYGYGGLVCTVLGKVDQFGLCVGKVD